MDIDNVLKCLKRPQKKVFVYALRTIFEAIFKNAFTTELGDMETASKLCLR
jgi:hypothetical protein